MIQPVQTEVETRYILVLSCSRYGLVHGRNGFGEAAEVCVQDRHMKQGVLVVGLVANLQRVVEVSV